MRRCHASDAGEVRWELIRDALASVGSAALDNEECYMFQKLLRSWSLVYIEHQARI